LVSMGQTVSRPPRTSRDWRVERPGAAGVCRREAPVYGLTGRLGRSPYVHFEPINRPVPTDRERFGGPFPPPNGMLSTTSGRLSADEPTPRVDEPRSSTK